MPIYDPNVSNHFANAAGWFDDTSDGPVSASVKINGVVIPVESAWVVVAQPDFSPNTVGWRTLYDLMTDTYHANGWLAPPERPSFSRDVLPIFQRLSGLQWVNKGFATLFGQGAPFDFNNPLLLAKLSRTDETFNHLRQAVFNAFRGANNAVHEPRTWPWLYGDTFGADQESAHDHLAPSPYRSQLLKRWVKGEFHADWTPDHKPPAHLDDVNLADQPAMLDQAALHFAWRMLSIQELSCHGPCATSPCTARLFVLKPCLKTSHCRTSVPYWINAWHWPSTDLCMPNLRVG